MFATAALLTSSLARVTVWESNGPLSLDMKVPANETCWSYDWGKVPAGCPKSGWIKTDEFHFVKAHVGGAGISVDANNNVGLVVTNMTWTIAPTKFTAQEQGLFTVPCEGVVKGLITGATAAVEALIQKTAEGIPIIGEAAAKPIDGVVVKLEHELNPDTICTLLTNLINDIVDICGSILHNVIQADLPPIVSDLLDSVLKIALNGLPAKGTPEFAELPEGFRALF